MLWGMCTEGTGRGVEVVLDMCICIALRPDEKFLTASAVEELFTESLKVYIQFKDVLLENVSF